MKDIAEIKAEREQKLAAARKLVSDVDALYKQGKTKEAACKELGFHWHKYYSAKTLVAKLTGEYAPSSHVNAIPDPAEFIGRVDALRAEGYGVEDAVKKCGGGGRDTYYKYKRILERGGIDPKKKEIKSVVRAETAAKVAQVDALRAEGKPVTESCRKLGMSTMTYYHAKKKQRGQEKQRGQGPFKNGWSAVTGLLPSPATPTGDVITDGLRQLANAQELLGSAFCPTCKANAIRLALELLSKSRVQ